MLATRARHVCAAAAPPTGQQPPETAQSSSVRQRLMETSPSKHRHSSANPRIEEVLLRNYESAEYS